MTVIPLTSRKKGRRIYPNEVLLKVEGKEAVLLCHQVRSVSKSRIAGHIQSIEDEALRQKISDTLCLRFMQV